MDVVLDREVFVTAMDGRSPRVCVHRLEADAEPADLFTVVVRLCRAFDPADAPDVLFSEEAPIVEDPQIVGPHFEADATCPGVLRVLQELKYEMRAVGVQVNEK